MFFDKVFNRLPAFALAVFVLVALLSATAALAAPVVDARMSVVRIESDGKTEKTASADRARPGDVLEYTSRYANRGDSAATSFMPTMQVPAGTEFVPGGTSTPPVAASLDGATFQPIPLRRTVKGADGKSQEVEVPAAEYRAVRWAAGTLNAGAETTVRARMRITPAPVTAQAAPAKAR